MGTAWEAPIQRAKRLGVFTGSSMGSGAWAGIAANAIREFNNLSTTHSLGVTLGAVTTPPDPSGVGGADVQIEAGNGTVNFTTFGQQVSVAISGTGLSGDTRQVKIVLGGIAHIAKAFIVVPATPTINANPPRAVGDPVKLVILVHELLHACGLSNGDHNPDDLFSGFPQARSGSGPADDRIEVNQQRRLPPMFLTPATAGKVKALWP